MLCESGESITSQADSHSVQRNEKRQKKKRQVALPSAARLAPRYRKVTTGGRMLSRAAFRPIHLSSPRHMCTSQGFLTLDELVASGDGISAPGKPMKWQRFYTSELTLFAQQRSHRQQSEGSQVFSGHQAVGQQVRLK